MPLPTRWPVALAVGCALVAGACTSSPAPGTSTTTTAASAAVTVSASPAAWSLPVALSRAVVVDDSGELVVLGGLVTGDTSSPAIWGIDPATGTSRRLGTLRLAVHDATGAFAGSRALVFGGGSASTIGVVQGWSQAGASEVGQLPQPRSDLAAAALGGTVYVAGGFDGTALVPSILATTDGATFRSVGTLAVPVRYPAVAAAEGALWIIGGDLGTAESAGAGGQTDAIQRFDPATGHTTVVGHLPEPLGHASALVVGGRLLVAGGVSAGVHSAQVWVVDTTTGAVRPAGTLPGARSDAAAVVVGATGYLLGGELTGPNAPLASVVTLTVR